MSLADALDALLAVGFTVGALVLAVVLSNIGWKDRRR